MGKQINYYMDDSTQACFFDFVRDNQFVLLSYEGKNINYTDINNYYEFYLYKKEFGELIFKEHDKSLDIMNCPVIEVIKTRIKEKKILCGRIWISDSFYKKNMGKLEYCKEYIDMYQKLCNWIKKNVPYQEVVMGGYPIKAYANDTFANMEKEGFVFLS